MGDVILFRSREKFMAEQAAKETPPLAEWAQSVDFTSVEQRAVIYACDEAGVDLDQVLEIIQHDGCSLEAAIMTVVRWKPPSWRQAQRNGRGTDYGFEIRHRNSVVFRSWLARSYRDGPRRSKCHAWYRGPAHPADAERIANVTVGRSAHIHR
jgi:hypothetical protein